MPTGFYTRKTMENEKLPAGYVATRWFYPYARSFFGLSPISIRGFLEMEDDHLCASLTAQSPFHIRGLDGKLGVVL